MRALVVLMLLVPSVHAEVLADSRDAGLDAKDVAADGRMWAWAVGEEGRWDIESRIGLGPVATAATALEPTRLQARDGVVLWLDRDIEGRHVRIYDGDLVAWTDERRHEAALGAGEVAWVRVDGSTQSIAWRDFAGNGSSVMADAFAKSTPLITPDRIVWADFRSASPLLAAMAGTEAHPRNSDIYLLDRRSNAVAPIVQESGEDRALDLRADGLLLYADIAISGAPSARILDLSQDLRRGPVASFQVQKAGGGNFFSDHAGHYAPGIEAEATVWDGTKLHRFDLPPYTHKAVFGAGIVAVLIHGPDGNHAQLVRMPTDLHVTLADGTGCRDGRVTGAGERVVEIWDAALAERLATIPAGASTFTVCHAGPVRAWSDVALSAASTPPDEASPAPAVPWIAGIIALAFLLRQRVPHNKR